MRRAAKVDANQPAIVGALRAERVWECENCGAQRKWTVHQARQKYCSRACVSEAYKTRMVGEGNPNHSGAGWKTCKGCGKQFHNYNKRSKYCSPECYSESRRTLDAVTCIGCGTEFAPNTKGRKYCSKTCMNKSKAENKKGYVPSPRIPHLKNCEHCGSEFRLSKSSNRKFCSYQCFLDSGGPKRAGEAAVMAKRKYGAKKDANHKEIFDFMRAKTAVHDLSNVGFGCPDGVCWVDDGWQLFDVKNPNTAYGRRGLNPIQEEWAKDWRGGPVYLVYNTDDAKALLDGRFGDLKAVGGFEGVE